ncbi:nucleoside hydrolase [Parapedobacter sp. 2B3]|uniref:nucleoside hydrolase n=1 Tax=Parapedobacter sp. 2B3 TaxID=3342381 RepID=UPI0035B63A7C
MKRITIIIITFLSSNICLFGNIMGDYSKKNVVFITDFYHPHQDFGDNFDIITPYALPEVDLKAVIIDVTDEFRKPISSYGDKRGHFINLWGTDKGGPREPGIIPLIQLNYIFDKNVQFAIGPFIRMRTFGDKMDDIPVFQQSGVELLLSILEESQDKVEIVVTGSARVLAVAYNRNPDLLLNKINRINLSAGSSSSKFQEWNVMLDPLAINVLLKSKLPIVIYPCATEKGPFDKGINNTYWKLHNMDFIKDLNLKLQNYISYAYSKSCRIDFLRAIDDTIQNYKKDLYNKSHSIWETAVWAQVTNRKLIKNNFGQYRLIPESQIGEMDSVFKEVLIPCNVTVDKDGLFEFEKTGHSNFFIYERGDPIKYEQWMQDALKALYLSFLKP